MKMLIIYIKITRNDKLTKLDYYYSNIDIISLNLNYIHLVMGFENN